MRLFVALDIDEAIRQRLAEFIADLHAHVPATRFLGTETFHVTLKFIGETNRVDEIRGFLGAARSAPFEVAFRGYGFFPEEKRARIFWAGIEASAELEKLASSIDAMLGGLGFSSERGPYKPHLTLARSGSGNPRAKAGNRPEGGFRALQQYLSGKSQPEFGTMTAREFILFESVLSPRGATYRKLERYPFIE